MGDRLWADKPRQYFTDPPRQLSLLPSARLEMSTSQTAAMLCGCGIKTARLIPLVDKRVGGRQNCVIPH